MFAVSDVDNCRMKINKNGVVRIFDLAFDVRFDMSSA